MRGVIPVAEQLDRARRELDIDEPINGRVALILIDNALELMCHQKVNDLLERDRARRVLTPRQRADGRGRAFDKKIAFLKDQGHIPVHQVRAIAIFHDYRNQLYHVGLRDDPIIGRLARRYLELTAGLMVPLLGADRHLRWEPTLMSDAALRVFPELVTNTRHKNNVSIVALANRLLAASTPTCQTFQAALRDQLLTRVDQSETDFAFIARGRSGKDDPDLTLRRIQLEQDTLAELARVRREQDKVRGNRGKTEKPLDDAFMSLARGMPVLVELNERLLPRWRPKLARRPFESWRKRARSLGVEADSLLALDAFDRVRREIELLDDAMAEPIYDMHGWHQHMEDLMMDRR